MKILLLLLALILVGCGGAPGSESVPAQSTAVASQASAPVTQTQTPTPQPPQIDPYQQYLASTGTAAFRNDLSYGLSAIQNQLSASGSAISGSSMKIQVRFAHALALEGSSFYQYRMDEGTAEVLGNFPASFAQTTLSYIATVESSCTNQLFRDNQGGFIYLKTICVGASAVFFYF